MISPGVRLTRARKFLLAKLLTKGWLSDADLTANERRVVAGLRRAGIVELTVYSDYRATYDGYTWRDAWMLPAVMAEFAPGQVT